MVDLAFAESRFGLGPRGNGANSTGDGRDWAEDQVGHFNPALALAIPSRAEVAQGLTDFYEARRDTRQSRLKDMGNLMTPASMPTAADPAIRDFRRQSRDQYARLVEARLASALTTPTPLMERMVHFWANHFAISATKQSTVGFGGLLEMEAIRPHVAGRFGDMLLAVERHPAMLLYLDQAASIGPASPLGARAAARGNNRGLNENLAREILELHTLGVRTGYDQSDVTEFAKALTGWTVAGIGRGPATRFLTGNPGDFTFVEALHEPGERTVLGRRVADGGEQQARDVLQRLAIHPATARHIATKLARHFAADDPPPAMVARIEKAFLTSGGDLPAVYRAVLASPEAWDPDRAKFRNPWDWSLASLRALGVTTMDSLATVQLLKELGQPVWQPPSPAGWDDDAAAWAGPDALVRRVEAAQRLAEQGGEGVDARRLAPRLLGARLSPATTAAIARAESPKTGLALLLASPEMLRR